MSFAERFWTHVDRRGDDDCWLWTGATQRGYGAVRQTLPGRIRRQVNANRVAFALTYGPISEDDHVMHTCDTPLCVNPAHLLVGTRSDNMRDAAAKGRMSRKRTARHLDPAMRGAVWRALANGEPVRQIARELGTSPVTVRRIRDMSPGPEMAVGVGDNGAEGLGETSTSNRQPAPASISVQEGD